MTTLDIELGPETTLSKKRNATDLTVVIFFDHALVLLEYTCFNLVTTDVNVPN